MKRHKGLSLKVEDETQYKRRSCDRLFCTFRLYRQSQSAILDKIPCCG